MLIEVLLEVLDPLIRNRASTLTTPMFSNEDIAQALRVKLLTESNHGVMSELEGVDLIRYATMIVNNYTIDIARAIQARNLDVDDVDVDELPGSFDLEDTIIKRDLIRKAMKNPKTAIRLKGLTHSSLQ